MATPFPSVQLALTTKPTEAPVWVDVTDYVRAFSLRRGKQGPLESVGVGSGSLTLDNRDRRFDPSYTAGPYYGNLKSTRRGRIRGIWNGGTYDLMHFYVDSWPLRRTSYGNQYVEVTFSDALKVFSLVKLTLSRPQERTDERIAAVLSDLNWTTGQGWVLGDATYGVLGSTSYLAPVGDRALDQGATNVQASVLTREQALSHLQAVERTEFGFLFQAKNGGVTFHNRTHRLLAGSTGSLATFGDNLTPGSGELPYADAVLEFDERELYNDFAVSRSGGSTETAEDATSIANHFPRTLEWSTIGTTDAESAQIATYLKNRYSTQRLRVTQMVMDPEDGTELVWPQLFGRDLGDVITFKATPLGGGNRISQVSFIDGMSIDWNAKGNDWGRPVWNLSPADTTPYWVLGQSLLGTNTYLGL